MRLITCAGIGERIGDPAGMLAPIRAGFASRGVDVYDLPWRNDYGPVGTAGPLGASFAANLTAGQKMLDAELNKGPAIIACYSGGAALGGNIAAAGHPNLVAIGLVADPYMPNFGTGKYGVAGSRPIVADKPVYWEADPNDIICQCPANSPIRGFSDLTHAFAFSNQPAYAQDLANRLIENRWQRWWDVPGLWRIGQALQGINGYLWGGDHTSYQIRRRPGGNGETYIEHLQTKLLSHIV
jgi:hypothetical protein